MSEIRNIVFDMGEVLMGYRWEAMLQDYGLSREKALEVGHQMFDEGRDLWHIFDLADRTDQELIEEYQRRFPENGKYIAWFIRHGEYMHTPRPEIWEMVHGLKEKGYGIYLLSNYPESLFKKHTQYCDFMEDLDGMMVSYMIHIAKPDPRIFQALCDRYGLKKEQCLFFDDRAENVEGARGFGMQAEQVVSRAWLATRLTTLLQASYPAAVD